MQSNSLQSCLFFLIAASWCMCAGTWATRSYCLCWLTYSLSLKVKVWFQNRRMKWKRVKGGQQGAAAREKELVNVKKGTLLPSELSGIGAATLQQTGDSLANEDSRDSDHSSEHAHLWYLQRPAQFSGKHHCDGKPYRTSFTWQMSVAVRLSIIKCRHLESVSHDG